MLNKAKQLQLMGKHNLQGLNWVPPVSPASFVAFQMIDFLPEVALRFPYCEIIAHTVISGGGRNIHYTWPHLKSQGYSAPPWGLYKKYLDVFMEIVFLSICNHLSIAIETCRYLFCVLHYNLIPRCFGILFRKLLQTLTIAKSFSWFLCVVDWATQSWNFFLSASLWHLYVPCSTYTFPSES